MFFLILSILILKIHGLQSYIVLFKQPASISSENEVSAYSVMMQRTTSKLRKNERINQKLRNGFVGELTNETAEELRDDPMIAQVEADRPVFISKYGIIDTGQEIDVTKEGSMNPNRIILVDFGTKTSRKLVSDAPDLRKRVMFETYDEYLIMNNPINDIILPLQKKVLHQKDAPWGISRLSGGYSFGEASSFKYPTSAGQGIKVYVIDTGIDINHVEFEGRASFGANFVIGSINEDENGHGTHCAGTIAGKNTGVAKKADVIAVKVLDKSGIGMVSRLIMGVDYVIEKYIEDDQKFGTVVNMSVGGLRSGALDYAIEYAASKGIHFSAAAGNDHEDACEYSPGSSKSALTVGASNRKDKVAFFSNHGSCVNVYAPGVKIISSWINKGYAVVSGTSMAAPHVSGVMALYLGEERVSPAKLRQVIVEDAENVVFDETLSDFRIGWPFFRQKKSPTKDNGLPLVSITKLVEGIQEKELK